LGSLRITAIGIVFICIAQLVKRKKRPLMPTNTFLYFKEVRLSTLSQRLKRKNSGPFQTFDVTTRAVTEL
jgi:hypothetical protein